MLEHLFGSKTRVKLLRLFLRNPAEPIFVRELTRRVETQINAVRRELTNLVKLGLVIEADGAEEDKVLPGAKKRPGLKRKYYQLNKTFPLLNELSSLILKAQVLLDRRLDQEIAALGDVRYLAFMGAFIQSGSTVSPNTPAIDLFLVGKVDPVGFKKLMTEVEGVFGSELNFSILAPDEFRYRKELGDRFLHSILEAPKKVLIDRLHER
ncbi:hypothetical protein KBD34_01455 [Patescibacteria group bacterium]|nr:hypothetical protein [Patescibacteria group bacterium]